MGELRTSLQSVIRDCYESLKEVSYEYLRLDLKEEDVLTQFQFSDLDSLSPDLKQNVKLFQDFAHKLSKDGFEKLIDIVQRHYPHVKLKESYYKIFQNQTTSSAGANTSFSSSSSFQERQFSRPMGISELNNNSHQPLVLTGNECEADIIKTINSRSASKNQASSPELSLNEETGKKVPDLQHSRVKDPETYKKVHLLSQRIYPMDTSPRGLAFIVNNVDFKYFSKRDGSDMDRDKLCVMFKRLDWHVTSKTNLTAQDMDSYLRRFSQHKNLKDISAMAVVIMTHGMDDIYFGTDGRISDKTSRLPASGTYISKFELMQYFVSSRCKDLKGKPKWFILQACRGDEEDKPSTEKKKIPTEEEDKSSTAEAKYKSPQKKHCQADHPCEKTYLESIEGSRIAETGDMCFMFSSSKGYKAYRTKNSGSPFIKVMTETVLELSTSLELCEMMREVQQRLSKDKMHQGKMTLPDFSTQLTQKWFLKPPKKSKSTSP